MLPRLGDIASVAGSPIKVGWDLADRIHSWARAVDKAIEVANAEGRGVIVLSGDEAFKLHSTFGLPFERTCEVAAERGMIVDHREYENLRQQERDRSRATSKLRGLNTKGD